MLARNAGGPCRQWTMKPAAGALLTLLKDPGTASAAPLYRQVYQRVRTAVLAGELSAGARLPSSRRLAADVRLSRNTVELAFAQLEAEGYLVRRRGSGTYVCRTLPGRPIGAAARTAASKTAASPAPERPAGIRAARPPLSPRGHALVDAFQRPGPEVDSRLAFGTCGPALDHFPTALWNRLAAKRARLAGRTLLRSGDAGGYRPLREAIASYLGAARGVRCRPEQVIVTTSTQQSLDLAARLLLEPGDRAWMEDPGYRCARAALEGNRVRAVPVPVDDQGLDVAAGKRRAPRARLAYITPSHQYPLGVTLSLERRLELLRWAEGAGAWVFEDDYDSEYRYDGRPLAALQGLDTAGQVLYAGTFHKVLFPGLRLAYLVVPEILADAFGAAREATDGFCPPLTQAVVADFLTQGHFSAHLRQTRALYRQRRDALRDALGSISGLTGILRLGPVEAGLHLTGFLPSDVSDRRISDLAASLGLGVSALSGYYADAKAARPGLIFHYAALSPERIVDGVARLAAALAKG